jgi:hypothetical protein
MPLIEAGQVIERDPFGAIGVLDRNKAGGRLHALDQASDPRT